MRNEIFKKVVFNYSYGCWGNPNDLDRTFVTFYENKITFSKVSLGKPTKDNCNITVTYNPHSNLLYGINSKNLEYEEDFMNLCMLVHDLPIFGDCRGFVTDCCSSNVVIYYKDGKHIYKRDISTEPFKEIQRLIKKYTPNVLSMINEFETEGDY